MLGTLLGCASALARPVQKPVKFVLRPILLLVALVFLAGLSILTSEYFLVQAIFKRLSEVFGFAENLMPIAIGSFFFLQAVILFGVILSKVGRMPEILTSDEGNIRKLLSAFVSGFKSEP
jgi:hypothetical protein